MIDLKGSDFMDQVKIGQFIAALRKSKNMTQMEMAEKLGVSNKSVSRWENGKNMPDVSLFLPICELLDISVNELIIGEKIKAEENTAEKAEKILLDTIDTSNKKINHARIIIYIAMALTEAFLLFAVPLTASPSDAMAVPLSAILTATVTSFVIGMLDISLAKKFTFLPITIALFIPSSLLYFTDAFYDYTLSYIGIIVIVQFVIILLSALTAKLCKRVLKALKNKKQKNKNSSCYKTL